MELARDLPRLHDAAALDEESDTKGKYLGTTTINAPIDIYRSQVLGTLVVNGKTVPKGRHGGDPW